MNIDLIVVGKTDMRQVDEIVQMYQKRINHYTKFNIITLNDVRTSKKLSPQEQKRMEGGMILKLTDASDHLVLLDENGSEYGSETFAGWMQKKMNGGMRKLNFVIGGPYGFSDEVYARSNERLSLSKMTFSHQIIRAIFTEQLYRAFTILNNEPYHHK